MIKQQQIQQQPWYEVLEKINKAPIPDTLAKTLLTLYSFQGSNEHAWPSWRAIAERRGLSGTTCRIHTAALIRAGYITVESRQGKSNIIGYPFLHTDTLQPIEQIAYPVTPIEVTGSEEGQVTAYPVTPIEVADRPVTPIEVAPNKAVEITKKQQQAPTTPKAVVFANAIEQPTATPDPNDTLQNQWQDWAEQNPKITNPTGYAIAAARAGRQIPEQQENYEEHGGKERELVGDIDARMRAAGYFTREELQQIVPLKAAIEAATANLPENYDGQETIRQITNGTLLAGGELFTYADSFGDQEPTT